MINRDHKCDLNWEATKWRFKEAHLEDAERAFIVRIRRVHQEVLPFKPIEDAPEEVEKLRLLEALFSLARVSMEAFIHFVDFTEGSGIYRAKVDLLQIRQLRKDDGGWV